MKSKMHVFLFKLFIFSGILAVSSCATQSPNLHLIDGKLRLCPKNPNCVSSESEIPLSKIDPITFQGEAKKAMEQLKQTLKMMGAHLQGENDNYLWVTFSSKVFKFHDDTEFKIEPSSGVIQVRSGARFGYSDFSVNRKRIDHLRRHFAEVNDKS